jgi:hypothetical protein
MKNRQQARDARDARVAAGRDFANHKTVETRDGVALLEAVTMSASKRSEE